MDWTTISAFSLLVISGLLTGSIVYWSLKLGITPTPTSPKVKRSLLTLLPDSVTGTIYDAGCGFGTLCSQLNKKYPSESITGLELSLLPYYFCRLRFAFNDQVTIQRVNIFDYDFTGAGLIVCYLYPDAMTRLSGKFKTELTDENIIITHTFRLPGWTPDKTVSCKDIYRTPVYLYRSINERQASILSRGRCKTRESQPLKLKRWRCK